MSTNPAFAISLIFNFPEEKTIALGGVPTGSINAQLAARVIGIHSCKISKPESTAKDATTGTKTETNAMFDIISVPKIAINTKTPSKIAKGAEA